MANPSVCGTHLVASSAVPSKSSWKVHDHGVPSALRGRAPQASYRVGGGLAACGLVGAGIRTTKVRLRRLLVARKVVALPAATVSVVA